MLLDPVYRVSPTSHTKRSVSAGTCYRRLYFSPVLGKHLPVKTGTCRSSRGSGYGCQCLGFLTRAQTLMHAIAHGGCTDTGKVSALKVDWRRRKKIPCRTVDSNLRRYQLRLTLQSDALPTEVPYTSVQRSWPHTIHEVTLSRSETKTHK